MAMTICLYTYSSTSSDHAVQFHDPKFGWLGFYCNPWFFTLPLVILEYCSTANVHPTVSVSPLSFLFPGLHFVWLFFVFFVIGLLSLRLGPP